MPYEIIGTVSVDFDGECYGAMGPHGNRTVVRKTISGQYAVITAARPYRLIKLATSARLPANCWTWS